MDEILLEQAIRYYSLNEFEKAAILYSKLLKDEPNNFDIAYVYGMMCFQIHNYNQAQKILTKAFNLNINEDDSRLIDVIEILAEIAEMNGDNNLSVSYYEKMLELLPGDLIANYKLGNVFLKTENFKKALFHYNKALRADPECNDVYLGLLNVYIKTNNYNKQIECFNKLLEFEPDNAVFYFQLALLYEKIKDALNATNSYKKAIVLNPEYVDAYINLGELSFRLCLFDQAIICNQQALLLNPNHMQIYNNLANVYIAQGKIKEAIEISKQGLKLFPDDDYLKFGLSRAQMHLPDLEEGWKYFYHRKLINERKSLKAKEFLLDYKGDLNGKTVYVHWDSGYGDSIQFVRYLLLLRDLGVKVLFKPQSPLFSLMIESKFNIEIIPDNISDDELEFDLYVNLTSLLYIFKTNLEDIPYKDAYLSVTEEKINSFKQKYFNNNNFKIGIVWQASNTSILDTLRSIKDINLFYPIAKLPNVKLYSFLKGNGVEQLKNLPSDIEILNLGDEFNDFSDTAAAVKNLDLVITVDTSVAHLGGSLGVPTWILLNYGPNWRWFIEGDDSPWYNSVKLYRQNTLNSWDETMKKVYNDLQALLKT